MSEARGAADVDVYAGEHLAGRITRTPQGCFFEYQVDYLAAGGPGLAFHLPRVAGKFETHGVNLPPFFAGLLPEGLRLKALVRRLKTSEDDLLSLLAATGADCIGDVSVAMAGQSLRAGEPGVDVTRLHLESFDELLAQSLDGSGDAAGRFESSLPGVQEKISAAVISFPVQGKSRRVPRSYILKLNPPDKAKLVENEMFFLRMAADCGLATAAAKLVRDRTGQSGLLVERFDREPATDGTGLAKLHQEDACQFLNRYPADKYLIPCSAIAEGFDRWCSAPMVELAKLLRLWAFSYVIGNGDLHAKNISLRTSRQTGRIEMTPAYDVLSTWPYGDRRMALKLEGRDDNLKRAHFREFGLRYGLPPAAVDAQLDALLKKSPPWVARLEEIGLEERKLKDLRSLIGRRLKDLV